MIFLFWASFSLIFYVYFIYPLLIYLLSKLNSKNFTSHEIFPPLSVIITAYNEEVDIASKIENTLFLDYPEDKIEIIVGSDGSTDKTNDIVKTFEKKSVRLIAFPNNCGKTITQNECVKAAKNEIIVFMDAASICEKNALKNLVSRFSDPCVGSVAGRIEFVTSKDNIVTESQGFYWKYEQFLKESESRIGSLVGVDGPLYAIKKELYFSLASDMISDLITPLLVLKQGYSVVLASDAVTYEKATKSSTDEKNTRRRVVLRGLIGFFRYYNLMNPVKYPCLAWQIISHKILRWLVGIFFIIMMISSGCLIYHPFYFLALFAMIAFLFLALLGYKNPAIKNLFFVIPYYFILVNWAALLGVLDFVRGKRIIKWKPVR